FILCRIKITESQHSGTDYFTKQIKSLADLMNKLLLLLPLLTLTACTNTAATSANAIANSSASESLITPQMLAHRHFVLTQVDQTPVQQGNTMYPGIDFYENNQLGATFCHELQGTYRIDGQRLVSDLRPLTQQNCANPEWEKWDVMFTQMLQQGATLTWQNQTLHLTDGQHTMQFKLKDWVY
ncbi:MAG: META domain-containing protein, partial [Plesiomonas shigelloides]